MKNDGESEHFLLPKVNSSRTEAWSVTKNRNTGEQIKTKKALPWRKWLRLELIVLIPAEPYGLPTHE